MNGVTLITNISVENGGLSVKSDEWSLLITNPHWIVISIPKVARGGKLGLSIPSKLSG